jgi:glycolate oxidase
MALIDDLRALLGDRRVKWEPLELRIYGRDAGAGQGTPVAVVLPESTSEVAECVRIARKWDVTVLARGAGTGLAGGAVPTEPSLVIALTRMNEVGGVDLESRTAWVGPGVINLELSQKIASLGVHFAPDPSSQAACTIGGNVATNAGGPHCLADGTTIAHTLGVEMVTVDGDIVTLGGPAPDPIGLDLRAIVVGSEGTLGIVTRVLVKLTENAPAVHTMLIAFDSVEASAATVSGIIAAGIVPAALEIMDQPMVRAIENFVNADLPIDAAAVLLAEVTGHSAAADAEAKLIEAIAGEHGATDFRIAENDEERALLWKARKSAFGAVAQAAPDYYLHDTVVPRVRLVEVMSKIYEIADRYSLHMLNVFHAGDGNLHPLVAFDARDPEVLANVTDAVREMVLVSIAAGGSLSGEHGIGSEKRDMMDQVFGPVDLDAQARLRQAFDPLGRLNPGKILPAGSRCYDYGVTIDLGEAL